MALIDDYYIIHSRTDNSIQLNPCRLYERGMTDRYANPCYMGCFKYADSGEYQCGATLWYPPYWLVADTGDDLTISGTTPQVERYVTLNDPYRTFNQCDGRASLFFRPLFITCDWYDADGNFQFSNPAEDSGLTPPDLDPAYIFGGVNISGTDDFIVYNVNGDTTGTLLGIPTGGTFDMSHIIGDIALDTFTSGYMSEHNDGALVPVWPTPRGYLGPAGPVNSDIVFSQNKNGEYQGLVNPVVTAVNAPTYNLLDGEVLIGPGNMGHAIRLNGSECCVTLDTLNIHLIKQSPNFPSVGTAYDNTTLYSGFMYRFLREV